MPPINTTSSRVSRRFTRRALRPPDPIPAELRGRLITARDPVDQFTIISDYLRPQLVRRAAACGVGHGAEDVAAEVIGHWYNRVAMAPPVTYTTPHAYQHLRADLLTSVRNAAMSWHRDTNNHTITIEGGTLTTLVGAAADVGVEEVFDIDDALALSEALSRLDAVEAEVARMVGLEALSMREVSDRLAIPSSTVADVWGRVQQTLRVSVERYLTGEYCREAAPHLSVLDVQRHAERRGLPYRPLDDALGEVEARRVARHVYGDPQAGASGCAACRRARQRQRTALGVFLPPPLLTPAVFDQVRDVLVGAWDATFGSLARLIDDTWTGLAGSGGAAAGLGAGKVAALVAAATVAVTAPTVVPDLIDHPHATRPAVAQIATPKPRTTVPSAPPKVRARATASKPTADTPAKPGAKQAVVRPSARPEAPVSLSGGSGSALAEFTPGP